MRLIRIAAAFVIALAAASAASAHPAPFSYLDVRLSASGLAGTLVLHDFDVAHELGLAAPDALLDPSTLEGYAEKITSLIEARLRMSADGRDVQWQIIGVRALPDRTAVEIGYRVPLSSAIGHLTIHAVLFPYDPTHQTF